MTFCLLISNVYIFYIIVLIPCILSIYLRYKRNNIIFSKCYGTGKIAAIFSVLFPRPTFVIFYLFGKRPIKGNNIPIKKSKKKALQTTASILLLSISLNSLVGLKSYAEPLEETPEVITEEEPEGENGIIEYENVEQEMGPIFREYSYEEMTEIITTRRSEAKHVKTLIHNSKVGDYDYIMYFPSYGHMPTVNDPFQEWDGNGYNPAHTNIVDYYGYSFSENIFGTGTVCLDCIEHQVSSFTIPESKKLLQKANDVSSIEEPRLRFFIKALCDANIIKPQPIEESKNENIVNPESSQNNNTIKPSTDKERPVRREDLFQERKNTIGLAHAFLKCLTNASECLRSNEAKLIEDLIKIHFVKQAFNFVVDL